MLRMDLFIDFLLQLTHMRWMQASDGLWAHVSDQLAVDTVSEVIEGDGSGGRRGNLRSVAKAAAQRLACLARDCGSSDDVSIIINAYEWA